MAASTMALKSRSTSTSLASEERATSIGVTELYSGGDKPEFESVSARKLLVCVHSTLT